MWQSRVLINSWVGIRDGRRTPNPNGNDTGTGLQGSSVKEPMDSLRPLHEAIFGR